MIRRLLLATLACLAPSLLAGQTQTAPAPERALATDAEVQAILAERVAAGGAVGIAVGLLEADGSTRTFVSGSAGEGVEPLSSSTLFEIGSITKAFTGILLAEMARRGEVSLDDPVQMYLPDGVTMPTRNGREITLVDLAMHRSGLPRLPTNLRPSDPADPYADYTADLLHDFLSSYELQRDIGSVAEYSNLGAGLLGHVLSLRLDMDYEEAIRARVTGPLGMDHTTITLEGETARLMARGHDPGGDVVSLWDVGVLAGAGGLRSNVDDMLLFLAANVGEPETELERAMRDAHEPRSEFVPTMDIGLHWITRTTDERRVVWHNGGTAGFRTFTGFDPDARRAVVVLTNSGVGADDIGFHLLDPESPLSPPTLPEFARREAIQLEQEVLERYVGVYELRPGVVFTFELVDGALRTWLTGQPAFTAYAASETVFFLRAVAAEVEFEIDEEGSAAALVLRQNGQSMRAPKVR